MRRASGYAFYNTSPYTFGRLLDDPANLANNPRAYIAGFSANMREVVEKFDFDKTLSRLDDAAPLHMVCVARLLHRSWTARTVQRLASARLAGAA